jgi:hypothetical protein
MTPLPLDCEAAYCPDFLAVDEAAALFAELLADYPATEVMTGAQPTYMFGEVVCLEALHEVGGPRSEWPGSLTSLRDRIADRLGGRFEVARAVYYQSGEDQMRFHCDLPAYGCIEHIASLSLGAVRGCVLCRTEAAGDSHSIHLQPGRLIYMGPAAQQRYEHGLLPDPSCSEPRLNLTFRRFGMG